MTRRTKIALAGAGMGVLLLMLTWVLALHVGFFERADQSVFRGFIDLHAHRVRVTRLARFIATLCDPSPYVFLAAAPLLITIVRRRPRVLLAVGAILLGANVTTQLLKPLLAHSRAHWELGHAVLPPSSWPSGHATAAMSLALACVIAVPARLRPAMASLGAAFAVAVSYSFLSLGWHYPSDVFGGFLVAGTWTMLAVAGVLAADARWPRRADMGPGERVSVRDALAPQVALIGGAVLLAGLIALARPHEVMLYARAHAAFVVGAAAIGAVALLVASVITLTVRR